MSLLAVEASKNPTYLMQYSPVMNSIMPAGPADAGNSPAGALVTRVMPHALATIALGVPVTSTHPAHFVNKSHLLITNVHAQVKYCQEYNHVLHGPSQCGPVTSIAIIVSLVVDCSAYELVKNVLHTNSDAQCH